MPKIDYEKGWNNYNNGLGQNDDFVEEIIKVVPTKLQQSFSDLEYYSFIHYGMNTFTGREWGTGKEDNSLFSPKNVDTDQWVRVLKKSGSKGIIFTAKHHDGFCLFDTKYTDHSVMNSPFGRDIVEMVANSCRKYDMKFGIYLSPWDRHESTYGTEGYNDYFANQLQELCTGYGEIFCFWFDGAKGKDAPDFTYDFKRYFNIIHTLQPKAVISNCGEDVRWIGNEAGVVRKSEWNVVPKELFDIAQTMEKSQHDENNTASLQKINKMDKDLGSRNILKKYNSFIWYPGEADVSIHKGWFYNKKPKRKSLSHLKKIYFNTVGGNALLLMNVPVSKNGIIEKKDEKTLNAFGEAIEKTFKRVVNYDLTYPDNLQRDEIEKIPFGCGNTPMRRDENTLCCKFFKKEKIRTIALQENISHSQRVEEFVLLYRKGGKFKVLGKYTVIGSKKIIRLKKHGIKTREIRLLITQSRSNPVIRNISFYN